nr:MULTISPECIES: nitroreductase family protein [unclassified Exiguobacterium]
MHFDAPYINHMMQDVIGLTPEAQKGRHSFYRQFQEADFDLVSSKRAMRDWSAKQTYIALGNMMTSAAQIGIDSCPIEGFDQQAIEQLLREEGHLTDNLNVAVMAAFGYRNAAPAHAQTRQAIADLVDWV